MTFGNTKGEAKYTFLNLIIPIEVAKGNDCRQDNGRQSDDPIDGRKEDEISDCKHLRVPDIGGVLPLNKEELC